MTEQELRALVREALARHAGVSATVGERPAPGVLHLHPSHALFPLSTGSDADGPCLIEPAVMCTHCGYCKSYGH